MAPVRGGSSRRFRVVFVAVLAGVSLLGSRDVCADSFFHDEFSDADYTNDPTWTTLNPSAGGSFDASSGAFETTAPYSGSYGVGFSVAYVVNLRAEQELTARMEVVDEEGLVGVRYGTGAALGYGYAVALTDAGQARLVELVDTGRSDITTSSAPSGTAPPNGEAWVRLYASEPGGTGNSGESVRLLANVWYVGSSEPSGWMFDSWSPGSSVANDWSDGYARLAAYTEASEQTADGIFDDAGFHTPEPVSLGVLAAGLGVLLWRHWRTSARRRE